ncbi:receptor-like protein kinase FERONIA [Rutidosis leptorrhynchoides]|uniref:receptor-like protein kinase FERONIA n=1 Tax=Rutidosis leptorrhynchoides TaxID=125765 RepID=UPI003A994D6F
MRKAFIRDEFDRFLAPLARFNYENDVLNMTQPFLNNEMCKRSLFTFMRAAYDCTNDERAPCPDMNSIVNELEKALEQQLQYQSLYRPNLERLTSQLSHMKISLADISFATYNFSQTYFYIKTMFYDVYKVEYEDWDTKNSASIEEKNKTEGHKIRYNIFIKRLHLRNDKAREVFGTEIEMLTTCKHRNIGSLLGFCDEDPEKILVVEGASNGYLMEYFVNIKHKDMSILTWEKRLKICLDVACGLKYLHREMEDQKSVIIRSFWTGSIALDENLGAKFVEFGLSMFLSPNQKFLNLNSTKGHPSYSDPEYYRTGKLTRESDVYNLGVVLFEILCGRFASDQMYKMESKSGLVDVARRRYLKGTLMEIIDPIIKEANKYSINTFVDIAYRCVDEIQERRPDMKLIVNQLEEALEHQLQDIKGFYRPSLELLTSELSQRRLSLADFPPFFSRTNPYLSGVFYDVYRAEVAFPNKKDSDYVEERNESEWNRWIPVTIKRLRPREDIRGEVLFGIDMDILATCKHPNIVTLLGFCCEDPEKILVVEDASNGYLFEYLLNDNDKDMLLVYFG